MSTVAPAVEPVGPARTSGLAAIFGPYVVPYDPLASDTASALKSPSAAHWFGTDQLGRDIFSRVIVATRLDTFIAVSSVALVFLMGGLAGIGSYAVEALISSDFAPVQGFVLTMAVMYVLLNLTIDILYGVIDPRVRLEG